MGTEKITAGILSFIRQNGILLAVFALLIAAVIANWRKKRKKSAIKAFSSGVIHYFRFASISVPGKPILIVFTA